MRDRIDRLAFQSPIRGPRDRTPRPPRCRCTLLRRSCRWPGSARLRMPSRRPRRPRACCRSRARSPAPSPRRTTCSTSARSRSSPRRCCRSGTASQARGCAALVDVRVVRSHPMAFDQCRDLLAQLPHATAVAVSTTAEAAHQVGRGTAMRPQVAIVGAEPRRCYGLTVLADDVGDHTAFTRFVSIGRHTRLDVAERGRSNGVLVRHEAPAGRAACGDRAVRARRPRSAAARLAAAACNAVEVPLRRRRRRPSARSRCARCAAGRQGPDARAARRGRLRRP